MQICLFVKNVIHRSHENKPFYQPETWVVDDPLENPSEDWKNWKIAFHEKEER